MPYLGPSAGTALVTSVIKAMPESASPFFHT